ncbi:hypothetical protein HOLleu_43637 [Holothuria leucospilota]|uniref:Uncharacterized protein n=1 Tax=Holothuria leucospilota TaxID=206669 RepID=A0A9Q1BAY6_HOLLE|nr:hypothetical protein HOLleu_43637 [Holothuria leucospilota]
MCLLGQDSLEELSLVKRIYSAKSETVDIMSEFDDVLTGLGCVKDVIHHIMVDSDVPPVVHPPRKIPVALRAKVKEELKRMEELDVIEKVTSPTQLVNSMVSIPKNDKVRIGLDTKDLNKVIRREHFPMRTVEDVFQMPNAKVVFPFWTRVQDFVKLSWTKKVQTYVPSIPLTRGICLSVYLPEYLQPRNLPKCNVASF